MGQDFDFFKTTMPDSRKADFYLGCLGGSVFLDFNYTADRRKSKCLDDKSSKDFVDEIGKDNLDQEKIAKVVLELIRLNKDNIWTDALEEYNLIERE